MKRVVLSAWTLRLGVGLSLEPGPLPNEYLLVAEGPDAPGLRMRHRIRGLIRCERGGSLAVRTEEGVICRLAPGGRSLTFLLDLPPFAESP